MVYSNLRSEIADEMGVDSYACFDKERYAIPEFLVQLLSDAILVEFLAGFFEFSSLGKAARDRVDHFIETFRESPQLVTLNINAEVDQALTAAPVPDEPARAGARDRLVRFLVDYGLSEEIAAAHAVVIDQSVLATLSSRT
jgi:hypothetical protein